MGVLGALQSKKGASRMRRECGISQEQSGPIEISVENSSRGPRVPSGWSTMGRTTGAVWEAAGGKQ